MKKTFVKVVAAAAIVLGLASCDQITKGSMDPDGKDWASTKKIDRDDPMHVTINFDEKTGLAINTTFMVWTDEKGIVLKTQPTWKLNTEKPTGITFTFTKAIIESVDYNQKDGEAMLGSERFVLYTSLIGNDKDGNDLSKKDVRGRICVYQDSNVTVDITKYPETIEPVGIVSIKNDEPQASGSVYKNGDYTITEIWPLDPLADKADTEEKMANDKIGGKYGVVEAMYFKKLNIEKGDTVKFPVKAGKQIVGLYQPNRDKPTTDDKELVYDGPSAVQIVNKYRVNADGSKYVDANNKEVSEANKVAWYKDEEGNAMSRADLYGFADKVAELDPKNESDAKKITKYYADANIETIFANMIEVAPHTETPTKNSSSFGTYYFKHKDKVRFKAAANDYVVDVELVEASLEK